MSDNILDESVPPLSSAVSPEEDPWKHSGRPLSPPTVTPGSSRFTSVSGQESLPVSDRFGSVHLPGCLACPWTLPPTFVLRVRHWGVGWDVSWWTPGLRSPFHVFQWPRVMRVVLPDQVPVPRRAEGNRCAWSSRRHGSPVSSGVLTGSWLRLGFLNPSLGVGEWGRSGRGLNGPPTKSTLGPTGVVGQVPGRGTGTGRCRPFFFLSTNKNKQIFFFSQYIYCIIWSTYVC